MSDAPSSHQSELLYPLDARPAPIQAFFVALQHLLAIIVPIVTPPLIICNALGLPAEETNYIVSMSLLVSGVATFIQARRIGPLGNGLLTVQGTSFNFLPPIISGGTAMLAAGQSYETVLGGIFGVVMVAAISEMLVSRFLGALRRVITPLVTGTVVLLIGLTLIKVGLVSMGGGYAAMESGHFASLSNLLLSGVVLAVIIILNRAHTPWIRMGSIVIGLLVGLIVAWGMGKLEGRAAPEWPLIAWPEPFRYGFSVPWDLLVPMVIIYLVTALESIGDITATSAVSREPVKGPVYLARLKGGVLADGFNSMIAGLLNTFPNSTFSQNNGIIQLTGVASRYIGFWIAGLLVLMGLFPVVAATMQMIPEPVLGAAALIMFGSVAAAGINILANVHLDRRALLILAVSLAVGLGVTQVPDILQHLPEGVKSILQSGVATGGFTAMLLNVLLPESPSSMVETSNVGHDQ